MTACFDNASDAIGINRAEACTVVLDTLFKLVHCAGGHHSRGACLGLGSSSVGKV